ncbi:MAG: hypothetical protein R3E91_00880 [Chlamydiales bacterium]
MFPVQEIPNLLKETDTPTIIGHSLQVLAYSCPLCMGAAAPVLKTGEVASEKINSAIRTDLANCAFFFDRNSLIAKAIVDDDLILVIRGGMIMEVSHEKEIETHGTSDHEKRQTSYFNFRGNE